VALMAPPRNVLEAFQPYGVWTKLSERLGWVLSAFPGLVLTSWWRSPQFNREVGGADTSQHLLGLAFDVSGSRPNMEGALWYARAIGWEAVFEGDHVHLQAFKAGTLPRSLFRLVGIT